MIGRRMACRWLGERAFVVMGEAGPGRWSVTVESAAGVLIHRDSTYGTPMLAMRRARKLRDAGRPLPATNMRRATFTLGGGSLSTVGWTDRETWNGWAIPWFDRATGQQICRWLVQQMAADEAGLWDGQAVISWDAGRQTFISELRGTLVWVAPVRTLPDGQLIYEVTDGWTWDEVSG